MHKPLDLLLLLGHHDFYEMDSGYKETLTTLYFIAHMTGIYQPFQTQQIVNINIHCDEAVHQYFWTLKL